MTTLDIRPIAGALGAEIHGIDLSPTLDDETVAAIRRALARPSRHLLPRSGSAARARSWRSPGAWASRSNILSSKGIDGYPEIIAVAKLEHETVNFGGIWHSDTDLSRNARRWARCWWRARCRRSAATRCSPTCIPPTRRCRDGMKRLLDGLTAVNSSRQGRRRRKTREDRIKRQRDDAGDAGVPRRASGRAHPSGDRAQGALRQRRAHRSASSGMTEDESAPLLRLPLRSTQVQPEFTCRFRWRVGLDRVLGQPRAQHNPVNDYHGHRRVDAPHHAGRRPSALTAQFR